MSMGAHRQDKVEIELPEDLLEGGDAAKFDVFISEVVTRDGETLTPPRGGVTVIVGGNNAGKSTFLRDVWTKLSRPINSVYRPRLIDKVSLVREGEQADFFQWCNEHWVWSGLKSRPGFVTNESHARVTISDIRKFCDQGATLNNVSSVASLLVQRGDLHKRLDVVAPADQRDELHGPPSHPLHRLQDDPELLKIVKSLSERVFRQKLTLERIGRKTQLRVGETSVPPPTVDAITPEYVAALSKLDPLEAQGDGMKSLLGLLLPLVTASCRIMLIDEPEAFLHPPQAKIAGTVLGELAADRGIQIFIATHDRNFLVGLLEAEAPVAVVRLDRSGDGTAVHQLDHQLVRELWDEPVLKYSSVLDGLFHRAVVLAESDGDCRFYAASLDAAPALDFSPGDIQFTPVGGKDGFARVLKALRSVSVPTVVVADLDLLNNEGRTRFFVEMLGGDWEEFRDDYRSATQQFRSPRTSKSRSQVLELVKRVLEQDPEKRYDKETEGIVQAAIKAERSPWQDLKDYGTRAFKGGTAVGAAGRLLHKLEGLGAVLVREGELERLAPDVQSRKGPDWIVEALQRQSYLGDLAQQHIALVIRAIRQQW
ncbi:ATP-dependent nuclease [Streptomyces sp. NRRL S-474]|uniref:ATP-dependent nuclease n=1 Tax=Streptomyces sp. NRRL S-474 TaxID=1463909 RepID=UPI00099D4E3F|nr:AAA family ATPase [Streptomyces sp. NRRL S-474]